MSHASRRSRGPVWRFVVLLCSGLLLWASGAGFRSAQALDGHYRKHAPEFGKISKSEYLRLAQELRDTPAGGPVIQVVRNDGVITKFDRRKGYFVAYQRDGIIRTFFIPVEGERYFWRQAKRAPPTND